MYRAFAENQNLSVFDERERLGACCKTEFSSVPIQSQPLGDWLVFVDTRVIQQRRDA